MKTKTTKTMKRRRRWPSLRSESGQAIVEFALVLPLFLLLVVGILEFARAWNLHQVMTDAVREGARRAALADLYPVDSVKAPMWRYLAQFGYDPHHAAMQVGPDTSWKQSGKLTTVTLVVPYKIWVLGDKSFNMRSSFTVRNE